MGGASRLCTEADGCGIDVRVVAAGRELTEADVLDVGLSRPVAARVPDAEVSGAGVGCAGRSVGGEIEIEGDCCGDSSAVGAGAATVSLAVTLSVGAGVGADGISTSAEEAVEGGVGLDVVDTTGSCRVGGVDCSDSTCGVSLGVSFGFSSGGSA